MRRNTGLFIFDAKRTTHALFVYIVKLGKGFSGPKFKE